MTVQCLACSRWTSTGVDKAMVRLGFARCEVNSRHAGHTFSATYQRECGKFSAAPAETVVKRREWLSQQK